MGLRFAEQNVGHLKQCTFRISGTPARRTKRQKSQHMSLSQFMELQFDEEHVGNFETCACIILGSLIRRTTRRKVQTNMRFQNLWDSGLQNKTSEISTNALPEFLGLQLEEQNVGNLNKCTFRHSGTPVRRTTRPKRGKS